MLVPLAESFLWLALKEEAAENLTAARKLILPKPEGA